MTWPARVAHLVTALTLACAHPPPPAPGPRPTKPPPATALPVVNPVGQGSLSESTEGEDRHLRNIRQLTLDGAFNAEPQVSPDGKHVVFSNRDGPTSSMRVLSMDVDGRNR